MDLSLKPGAGGIGTRCTMALIALACGLLAAFMSHAGMLLIPLIAAPLAVVLMLERGKPRVLTVALPIALVALDVIVNGLYSFACLSSVIVAALIYVALDTGFLNKAESALAATALVSILAVLMIILFGCAQSGEWDFAASMGYFRTLVDDLRVEWIGMFESYMSQSTVQDTGTEISTDELAALYDNIVQSSYSFLVIAVFAVVGLTYKLFTAMFAARIEKRSAIYGWRFTLSPEFAIAYLLIYVLQLFADGSDAFSIVVVNLASILMLMFAYLGFMLADAYFAMKSNGRSGGKFLIVLSIIVFGSIALLLLSFVGVFASFIIAKAGKGDSSAGNEKYGG